MKCWLHVHACFNLFCLLSFALPPQLASQCSLRTRLNSSLVDRVQYMFPKRSHARIKSESVGSCLVSSLMSYLLLVHVAVGYVSSDFGNHPIGHLMQSG